MWDNAAKKQNKTPSLLIVLHLFIKAVLSVSSLVTLLPKRPPRSRKGEGLFKQKAGSTIWGSPNLEPLSRECPCSTPVATTCGDQVSFTTAMTWKQSLSSVKRTKGVGVRGTSFRMTHPT